MCTSFWISTALAVNVLLFPANINSHTLYFGRMAQALAQEGHKATMLMPSNAKIAQWLKDSSDVTVLRYNVDAEEPFVGSVRSSELVVTSGLSDNVIELSNTWQSFVAEMTQHQVQECDSLFSNEKLMKHMEESQFNLAIVDPAGMACNHLLPYKLGISYATFSVGSMYLLMRVPALPSFVPFPITLYSDKMNFFERAHNLLLEMLNTVMINRTTHYTEKYVPEKSAINYEQLLQQADFWFVLRDVVVNYPAPSMPNMADVGDLLCVPAKPLPSDLQDYMDHATEGVILVSLGSVFDHLPEVMAAKFCQVFAQLPEKVLWKTGSSVPPCELSANVKIMKWLPQNDLLAHHNMRMFVSHCGISSLIEAVYHAVPILAFPISVDQPFNAGVVRSHGFGEVVHMKNFTVQSFLQTARNILESDSIKLNLRKAAKAIQHKSMPVSKRISFWVNHITKYGAQHLRTAAFELNYFEFLMVDIVVVLTLTITIAIMLCCCVIYKSIKCCRRCCRSKGKRKTD